ncbi:phosphatase PAP2 family protein [Propylenella binzhouense]|uniref:Phosphatase PAP2 family protein n=1 Tax=Propylenella binzhouense TaxID=2555902 RepID=A0A964T7H1_9HYPH|nr:phosphatase PAP2 family protein [Propylenella binzhouense]MYZ49229.1 phosphatase PAP2 family protein [Propylenella binzhouense]
MTARRPHRRLPSQAARAAERIRAHPVLAALLLLVLVALPFLVVPALDLAASRLFYAEGTGFPGAARGLQAIRDLGRAVEIAFAAILALPLLVKLAFPESRLLVRPRTTLFVLLTYAIGPGLIVNALFKEHWGRARPRDIVEFGGTLEFTRVWQLAANCPTNCSFASGEAASAFFVVAAAFIVPRGWRRATLAAALLFAAIVSYARLAMGGHFLSDILAAWAIVLVVMVVLRELVLVRLPPAFDRRAEDRVAAAGRALRRGLAALRTHSPRL